jgi:5-methylcytosine-specific restriction endonuclease McrA
MALIKSKEKVRKKIESWGYEWVGGTYINCRSRLLIKFPNGHIWERIYYNLGANQGCGCTECYGKAISLGNTGKVRTEEFKKAVSERNSGSKNGMFGKKVIHSEEIRERLSEAKLGSKNPRYDSNKTDEQRALSKMRNLQAPGINRWKRIIKKRGKCEICESKENLIAHHLNSYRKYPEQRIDLNNGVCLCKKCHNAFHLEYGFGKNTEIQFYEWFENQY